MYELSPSPEFQVPSSKFLKKKHKKSPQHKMLRTFEILLPYLMRLPSGSVKSY